MSCWKYALAAVAMMSRSVELSLYYVSALSDWCWYVFIVGWFLLVAATLWSLVRAQWHALAVFIAVLIVTGLPAINIGAEAITRVQDVIFRANALRRINAVPLDEFLSKYKIVRYTDDNGKQQQIGQCDKGIRSVPWLYLSLIYDPSGEFFLPGYRRLVTWRLAVKGWTGPDSRPGAGLRFGSPLTATNERSRLIGAFYYAKIYSDEWTGNSED